MDLFRQIRLCASLCLLLATPLCAQIGDKAGEAQSPLVPRSLIPPAPALSPEEEMRTFKLAPGYHIELVASDPLVGDPVLATYGPDGRLWVVEMRGYMPDVDGSREDVPQGRVVVLTDTDGDGRMDKREVFLDGLLLPRALLPVRGGVLIGAPPYLWFCKDTDGDGKADVREVVATDFGTAVDPAHPYKANPERAPNSLLWGHDNWIYAGAYAARFRYAGGAWVRETDTFRGQWGLSQDDFGRLYHNSNSDQLRADLVASRHYLGHPLAAAGPGTNFKVADEQFVYPARVNPGINRGYRPEMLKDYRLKEFTAACAPWVYRGDLLAEAQGDAFICEPAGNLIKRNRLVATPAGTIKSVPAYAGFEFLASTDERFRPVNLTTAPDGALIVTDFYRGIIQHRISLTTYLRQHILDQKLDTPIALGRIWRIYPDGYLGRLTPGHPDNLSKLPSSELVGLLAHPNSWQRETAQQLLVERGDDSVRDALLKLAEKSSFAQGRRHALLTLQGILKPGVHFDLLYASLGLLSNDRDPATRAAALEVAEPFAAGEWKPEVEAAFVASARTEADPFVLAQLAGSISALPPDYRVAPALALARRAELPAHALDLLSVSCRGSEAALLAHAPEVPARFATLLLRGIVAAREPAEVEAALRLATAWPAPLRKQALAALAIHPTVNARRPVEVAARPDYLETLLKDKDAAVRASTAKVLDALTWPGKPRAANAPVPLTTEQQRRFDQGKQVYQGLCIGCHQASGKGLDGLAPPLAGSDWVAGRADRIIRIALHGLRGPVTVSGVAYPPMDMPAAGFLTDEQLAAVLTYVRREWGNEAAPVEPADVARERAAHAGRQDAWTTELLLK